MRDLVRNLGLTPNLGASGLWSREEVAAGVLSVGGRHRARRQGCQEAAAAPQARPPWEPGTWLFLEGLAARLCSRMERAARRNGIEGK